MKKKISFLSIVILVVISTFNLYPYSNPALDKLFYSWRDEGNPNHPYKISRAKVMFLNKNINSWFARWWLVSNAKKRIDLVYFSFFNDPFGQSLLGLLYQKALKGVKVRLLVDNRGAFDTTLPYTHKKIFEAAASCPNFKVKIYNHLKIPLLANLIKIVTNGLKSVWTSNHDKILIVDGQWVVIGGRNIYKPHYTTFHNDEKAYIDSDVLMRSKKVARAATKAFLDEFNFQNNERVKPIKNIEKRDYILDYLHYAKTIMAQFILGKAPLPPKNEEEKEIYDDLTSLTDMKGKYPAFVKKAIDQYFKPALDTIYPVRILDKTAHFQHKNYITDNIIKGIELSQKEIFIMNPYLVFTEKAKKALKDASRRGVKIIFFTASPQSSDEPLVQGLFVKNWKNIFRNFPTARLFVTDKRPLHSKIFIFDRRLVVIGTYNFDPLSQNINSEVVTGILSEKFAQEMLEKLNELIKRYCVEYRLEILPDGREKVIFGPENHCNKLKLLKLKLIYRQLAKIIRPLI